MTANLPAVPEDTGAVTLLPNYIYPQLTPEALGDPVWYDPPNQQVWRTLEVQWALAARGRPDEEIVRRGAAVLRYDPVTYSGTPLRCRSCGNLYTGIDGPPDWQAAGSEHADCVPCALKAPRHARPSQRKRDALGRFQPRSA